MNKLSPFTTRLLRLCPLVALSTAMPAAASEPKKVLVVTITTGFRHGSIGTAEKVLQKLSDDSSTFKIAGFIRQPDIIVPEKPKEPKKPADNADAKAKEKYATELKKYEEDLPKYDEVKAKQLQTEFNAAVKERLAALAPAELQAKGIDGVIFANTTGDLPLPDKDGFIAWVQSGKGFIGMHAATDTLHGFSGYGEMTGGEFNGHPWHQAVTVKVEDPKHPAAGDYKENFEITDEIYQFKNWERPKLHVILSLDPSNESRPKTKQDNVEKTFFERGTRPDKDYGVSWVREPGKGRVFYTSLGHRDEVWNDAKFQAHILGGIRWAVDAPAGKP